MTRTTLAVLLSVLTCPLLIAAAPTEPEEIVIIGERSLRERLLAAEVKAYDLFNQFNDEKRFEISCSQQKSTGTAFNAQNCMPTFKLKALQAQARDYHESLLQYLTPIGGVPDGSVSPQQAPAEMLIAGQMPAYQRKLKEVAEQHPEFLQAIIEFSKLRQQYEGGSSVSGK
jgi:hypothetical protein